MHRALSSALVLATLGSGALAQSVLKVPEQFATIQAAVDAAADGDKVIVFEGVYVEAVVVEGRTGLTLKARGDVVISPPAGPGLTLVESSDCNVSKFRVASAEDHGILLQDSSHNTLFRCSVDNAAGDGIRVAGGCGNTLDRCTVQFPAGHGISLGVDEVDASNGNRVLKSRVVSAGLNGVDVHGSENLVERCLVLEPQQDGCSVSEEPAASDNEFVDCRVLHPAGSGFVDAGSGTTLDGCKVVQAGGRGVDADDGSGTVVVACKVVGCGDDGLHLGGDDVELLANKVHKAGFMGVLVEGDLAVVSYNRVTAAAFHGFGIEGNDGVYTANSASGAEGDGFNLGGTGNVLTENRGSGSGNFDLNEVVPGDNTWDNTNVFGKVGP